MLALLIACASFCAAGEAETKAPAPVDLEVRRLVVRAKDQLAAGDAEHSIKILENILDQYPTSPARFEVYLILGRYYIAQHQEPKGVHYLTSMKNMVKNNAETLKPEEKDMYVEGLYWTGIGFYQQPGQSSQALSALRQLVTEYPNTIWANQAYYYIGMCHFQRRSWSNAIEALNLVGTSVDPESPSVEYVEAGWRFYVKIDDADLPVLRRLGKDVKVSVSTKSGDKEVITCAPLNSQGNIYIGSIATQVGKGVSGDNTLQIVGGDAITAHYVDDKTESGKSDVSRDSTVQVVSTASLNFTMGTYESRVPAAYQNQPLFVLLTDLDLDVSDKADEVKVKLVSRYKKANDDDEDKPAAAGAAKAPAHPSALDDDDVKEVRWETRDEVIVTLKELGEGATIHSGRFGNSVKIVPFVTGQAVDKADDKLVCELEDEVLATYVDELHINGKFPRTVTCNSPVIGEIENRPHADTHTPVEAADKAEKAIIEALSSLELGRIFKSMGLMKGSIEKCDEGLKQIEDVIMMKEPIPSDKREEAFHIKWELYMVKDDYRSAISTCRLFNKLFPQSPLVDQALMNIGSIKAEAKSYDEAIQIFSELLALPTSQVKAEAQFRMAQALENHPHVNKERAIEAYKTCAEKYSSSPFAGQSLNKLVDFFMKTGDYVQANDMLERIFQDYPDAEFLDTMLFKWVEVAAALNDIPKAKEKCSKLIADYPSSKNAQYARDLLPKLEAGKK